RIAASSRTVCASTITSRNPASADTTQDAPEHAGATWEALLKSALAILTPSAFSRSSLSGAAPWRTSALTLAPRSSKALAMRPPRLPVAPATTMVESFMIPILQKGERRCKVGADPSSGVIWRGVQFEAPVIPAKAGIQSVGIVSPTRRRSFPRRRESSPLESYPLPDAGHSRGGGNPVCRQRISKGLRGGFPLSRE